MASNYPVEEEVNIRVVLRCSPRSTVMPNALTSFMIWHNTELRQVSVEMSGDEEAPLQPYTFDEVFAPGATQLDVYNRVVPPILDDVLQGFKCTIIAYGPMGTGKTHTMVGDPLGQYAGLRWQQDSEAGIIPRFIYNIFEHLGGHEFPMRVTLREIYRGATVDLLLEEVTSRHHRNSRLVGGLCELKVRSAYVAWQILRRGLARRKKARMPLNFCSSRSHVVLSVTVKKWNENGPTMTGTLNLVDLASSKDFGNEQVSNKRAQEAADTHESLVALSRVIEVLAERRRHVPYGDSTLTRVLQDSLGGRTKTTIIATLPRTSSDLEETRLILESASKAMNIVNRAQANR